MKTLFSFEVTGSATILEDLLDKSDFPFCTNPEGIIYIEHKLYSLNCTTLLLDQFSQSGKKLNILINPQCDYEFIHSFLHSFTYYDECQVTVYSCKGFISITENKIRNSILFLIYFCFIFLLLCNTTHFHQESL